MFCMNCGTELPDGAKFCMGCGVSMGEVKSTTFQGNQAVVGAKIVDAKCTSCGATLEVDGSENIAICPYCDSTYVVEQAVNNYNINTNGNLNIGNATINIPGVNTENLLMRARSFEEEGELESALEYYDRVLDVDFSNEEAREGISRVKAEMENYVYYETQGNSLFKYGKLQLKKGILIFKVNNGKEIIYNLNNIRNIRKTMGCLGFIYEGKATEITYGCSQATEWVNIIQKAQLGIYPEIQRKTNGSLEKYILENYNSKSIVKAIKYYREQTGVSLAEAKAQVENLLR